MTTTDGVVTFLDDLRLMTSVHEADRRALAERRPGLRGIHQTTFGTRPPFTDANPPGNCTQAAVATILGLELDDTPHFVELTIGDPRPDAWWYVLTTWSVDRFGFTWLDVLPDEVRAVTWDCDPADVLLLAGGTTERGWNHSIVIDGNLDLVWDPNPGSHGCTELIDICVPVDPKPFEHVNGVPRHRILNLGDLR